MPRRAWAVAIAVPLLFVVMNVALFFCCFVLPFGTSVRIIYNANTIHMPVLFALAGGAVLYAARGVPQPRAMQTVATLWLLLATAMVATRIYATHIEPHRLQVREVTIASPKVTRPFTLLHISDIQSAAIGPYEQKVFDTVRGLNPDLILDTGDLLQPTPPLTYRTELPKVAALFRTLDPPLGMYMVEGDTTGPIGKVTAEQTGGIAYLHSRGQTIDVDGLRLRVFGLTLYDSTPTGSPAMRSTVASWLREEPDTLSIVFGHRPDFILHMNDLPIDLCLAGHTHGGQIRLPFIGPLITFTRIPRDWARGFREVGRTRLNVSAGIGAEHASGLPSIRINCPPEMTLIRIVPETSETKTH
ncbi:MAG: metallophosphoesterase [Candidatus Hydrogenedentes bacterium]|nr:metallophosphoesterase [Candidatus Hydrogenedentota bacterium]